MWAVGAALREAGAWEVTQGTSSRWAEGTLHVLLRPQGTERQEGGAGRGVKPESGALELPGAGGRPRPAPAHPA